MKAMVSIVLAACVLAGCGGKVDEMAQGMGNLQKLAESSKDAEKNSNAVEQRRAERKAKGDTLAMPADELKTYLPGDISGYTAGEPETASTQMEGFSYSQATRLFTRADGTTVKVQLTDYNSSELGYAGMAVLFAMKWSIDNAQEKSGTFQTGDPMINGHERFDKSTRNTTLIYGLGGRFILNVEAEKQDVAFARTVAEKVNLKKLAAM